MIPVEPAGLRPRPGTIAFLSSLAGLTLLLAALVFDWADLLALLQIPSGELNNRWVVAELATLRAVCAIVGSLLLLISGIVLWRFHETVGRLVRKADSIALAPRQVSLIILLVLTAMVTLKTLLQVGLYAIGYAAYGADDFARSLSADYWLYHRTFDFGWKGWLGLWGSGWLPFADYVFGLALSLNRDIFVTPKIVNLALSGIVVVAVYSLTRELFGRTAGVLAAALFAFQPWHVWLGASGMTSDLPSVLLIALFGLYLVRWLRTNDTRSLLTAAAFLGIANGFRYENWFFTLSFSALVIVLGVSRRRHGGWNHRSTSSAACALAIANAFPAIWMAASYIALGDWLPALHVTNAFMVGTTAGASAPEPTISLAVNQSPFMAQINMAVLAIGAFPCEIALSMAGLAWFLRSDRSTAVRQYLVVVAVAALLFVMVFKGRLPASLVFARYFLAFIVLTVPFAGLLLTQLFTAKGPWRNHAAIAACVTLLAIGALDLGRALNYPDMFPRDAIDAGWAVRALEKTGTVPPDGKILIERRQDWGDLGIVALVNKPERFVALNEFAYLRLAALAGLTPDPSGTLPPAEHDDVRGDVCDRGFQIEACKKSVLREQFSLVIVSSAERTASFREAFPVRSWQVGRYQIFDMR